MKWKVVIFDFDDTLFLKTTYEFIPNLKEMLVALRARQLTIMLLTYNKKAQSILKTSGHEKYFDMIVMMNSKEEFKSSLVQKTSLFSHVIDKSDILFFDNDPFNVYDMQTIGITSFLINPITGLFKDLMDTLLLQDFKGLKRKILKVLPKTYNYIDRTTYSQHLLQLDRLLHQQEDKRLHDMKPPPPHHEQQPT